jgi:hypothetical protein
MEAIRERKAEIASRTEAPEASDWRKSWGKVESTPVDKSVGSRPVSRVKDGDPLSAPRDYTKHAVSQAPRPGARSSVPPPPPLPVTPPGSGSVRAAGEPQYVPVPIVTVPPGRVPSVAPQMPAPQAPQPNAAFMTGAGPGGPPTMRNAFSDPGPSQPIPSETVPPDLVVNAFSDSAPDGTPVPAPAPPMVAGGYPMPPLPRMPVNAPMPPMQGMARMPMGMPMMRMPMGMPYVPAMSYPGVPHPAAMMRPGMPGPVNPMMQVPATSPVSTPTQAPSLSHLIEMLRKSDFPSQREWAAEQLAAQTGRNSAGAVSALADAARGDEAPLVRACCVRSLVRLQVNTPQVVALMQELHKDTDPRVRDAAAEALTAWGLKPADAGIQPAGGTQK